MEIVELGHVRRYGNKATPITKAMVYLEVLRTNFISRFRVFANYLILQGTCAFSQRKHTKKILKMDADRPKDGIEHTKPNEEMEIASTAEGQTMIKEGMINESGHVQELERNFVSILQGPWFADSYNK